MNALLCACCAGGHGAGLAAKMCNMAVVAASMAAVAEALAAGKRLGIDPALLTQVGAARGCMQRITSSRRQRTHTLMTCRMHSAHADVNATPCRAPTTAVGPARHACAHPPHQVLNSGAARCWSSDTYNPAPGALPAAISSSLPASRGYRGAGMPTRDVVAQLRMLADAAGTARSPVPLTRYLAGADGAEARAATV